MLASPKGGAGSRRHSFFASPARARRRAKNWGEARERSERVRGLNAPATIASILYRHRPHQSGAENRIAAWRAEILGGLAQHTERFLGGARVAAPQLAERGGDKGRGHRRARRRRIAPTRFRMQHGYAGRGEIDIIAAIGEAIYLLVARDRGHRDGAVISGRIHRARHRPFIAGGGDDDHPPP